MRRFFALLPIVFALTGCLSKEQSIESSIDSGTHGQSLGVPMPTAEILAALGPKNNIPIQRLLPDPIIVTVGKPKQFLDSPVSTDGELLVANGIVRGLQLYHIDPNSIEQCVQATGLPMPVVVNIPNPQNPMAMPIQNQMLISRRTTIITFNTAVEKSLLVASILDTSLDAGLLESLKRAEGKTEYYDLTPPNIIIPQRLALGLIDECTAVIVEGVENDIKAVFSNTVPKSAVLDRLTHTPIAPNDLVFLTSLEGFDISPEILEKNLLPLVEMGLPISFVRAITEHLRAMTISLNATASVGQPIVSFYAEGRDDESAKIIWETISGTITWGKTTLITMDEEAKKILPIQPPEFVLDLLNAMTVDVKGTRVNAVLNNFETLIPIINKKITDTQTAALQFDMEERRIEQLHMLSEIFAAYYTEHEKFPADIMDADGKPLLSWRVALLPTMGLRDFYDKFKLDEPWDSETNLKLQETMPAVFLSFTQEVALPKTVVRFFDSPGTPFSRVDLKLEDLENPQTTLMLIATTPAYAVEWTKPESLEFDIEKIAEIVDDPFIGVTFSRQIYFESMLPATDPQYETWKQNVAALIKGTHWNPQKSAEEEIEEKKPMDAP